MITVIHGDDIASSRIFFQRVKEKTPDRRTIAGSSVDMTQLAQLFDSENLFASSQTIFIEELLTKKKQSGDFEALLAFLNKHSYDNTIYLWEGKEVAKTILNKLKNVASHPYKLPQSLFQFLDSISPKNKQQALQLFHKTIVTAEQEVVFFMLIRHVRLMLALCDKEAQIDEVKRMASWQKSKIKKQAATFSKTGLGNALQQLHKIDYDHKTGATPMSLSASIDIFLMSL